MESILVKNQKIKTEWRKISSSERMQVVIRYDDECGNGHNTFSITGEIQSNHVTSIAGCIHEEIAKYFPEYAHLIKWHLVSSDEPWGYLANTLYHAGDKDCWGKRKGEVSHYDLALKFAGFPMTLKMQKSFILWLERLQEEQSDLSALIIAEIPHKDSKGYKFSSKYTYQGFNCEWHECPFDNELEAREFREALALGFEVIKKPTSWSEGKERELDAARSSAIWPDATDEELMSDDLKEKLLARLPKLMSEFRKDIEALGFVY